MLKHSTTGASAITVTCVVFIGDAVDVMTNASDELAASISAASQTTTTALATGLINQLGRSSRQPAKPVTNQSINQAVAVNHRETTN